MQQRLGDDRLGLTGENIVSGVREIGVIALRIRFQKHDVDRLIHLVRPVNESVAVTLADMVAGTLSRILRNS